jgi:hypothetical protein
MELQIKHPETTERFLLDIQAFEIEGLTIYKINFEDKRLSSTYGTIIIKRNSDNFWKFPQNADSFLTSLISNAILQIMNNEVINE